MITDKQLTLASSSFRRVPYSTIKCTDLYQIFTYFYKISHNLSTHTAYFFVNIKQ